jgi:hypothetical protein
MSENKFKNKNKIISVPVELQIKEMNQETNECSLHLIILGEDLLLPKGSVAANVIKEIEPKVHGFLKMDVNFAVELSSDDGDHTLKPTIDMEETYFNSITIEFPDFKIENFITAEFHDQFKNGENLFFKIRDEIMEQKANDPGLLTELNFGEDKTKDETLIIAWVSHITKGWSDRKLVKFAQMLNEDGVIFRTKIAIKKTVYNFRGRDVDAGSEVEGLIGRSTNASTAWDKIQIMVSSGKWDELNAVLAGKKDYYEELAKMINDDPNE